MTEPSALTARVDSVLEKFRLNGGRVTAARRAIVTTLLAGERHEHLTADEVAGRIQERFPEVAVSTVYRSLDALQELGVLEHLHVGHGPTVYHLVEESHLHLICRLCGTVSEMADSTLHPLADQIRRETGFAIEPKHFAINGVCSSCRSVER